MRKLFRLAVGILILGCASIAGAQITYTWNGDVTVREGAYLSLSGLVVAQNITSINIITTTDTGCATDIIVQANVTSGPNPIVGEYIDAPSGFQKGIYKITNVSANADGSLNLILNQSTCEGFPVLTGNATVGPAFRYFLHFSNTGFFMLRPGGTCDSQSSASFDYLDASGNLQTATAMPSTILCTLTKPATADTDSNGQYGVDIQDGTFSGMTTEGTQFNATFTLDSDLEGRSVWYAKSATWDPFLTGGGTGDGGKE